MVILMTSKRSNTAVGNGIKITSTLATMHSGRIRLRRLAMRDMQPGPCNARAGVKRCMNSGSEAEKRAGNYRNRQGMSRAVSGSTAEDEGRRRASWF